MSRIFYSVGGEGRGHATRALAMIEELRRDHELTVFAAGQAYELLRSRFREDDVDVRRIAGLGFRYSGGQKLDYARTAWHGIHYLARLARHVRTIREEIAARPPHLAIVDYEPSLPRAARACGVPYISLDHQHFLVTYDLSSLPAPMRRHAAYMGGIVRAYCSGQRETVVSSFYFPPLRRGAANVKQVGVMLRPEIVRAVPERRDHSVAYFRRFAPPGLLDILSEGGGEIRVYGLGERPPSGALRFFDVDEARFIEDLATCRALVTTAGNQLVGEALFLGKPVLALPERGNHEQAINGHFLETSGGGRAMDPGLISGPAVDAFMRNLDEFRYRGDVARLHGNPAAWAAVRKHLQGEKPLLPRRPFGIPVKTWASE